MKKAILFLIIPVVLFISIFIFIDAISAGKTPKVKIFSTFDEEKTTFQKIAEEVIQAKLPNKLFADEPNEHTKEVKLIFEKYNFLSIQKSGDSFVYFIKDSGHEFGQGIIFSKAGEQPINYNIVDIQEMDRNWFWFVSK